MFLFENKKILFLPADGAICIKNCGIPTGAAKAAPGLIGTGPPVAGFADCDNASAKNCCCEMTWAESGFVHAVFRVFAE